MKKVTFAILLVSVIVLTSIAVYSADAAGIPKKAISLAARFVESDLPTTTIFTDVANTITAAITMNSLTLGGDENANSHKITSLATPTLSTDAQVANHLGLLGSLITGACANNQILKYQTSNSTWTCQTDSGLTSAITSINSDTTASQTIASQSGNTTVTDAGATHTIGLGVNPVITGGSDQPITKSTFTINNLKLGGAENANNQKITSLGTPTLSTDAEPANRMGLLGNKVIGTCANNQILKYQSSNTTWTCQADSGLTAAVTSINLDSSAGQTISGTTGNITVNNVGATHTIGLGSTVLVNNKPATITALDIFNLFSDSSFFVSNADTTKKIALLLSGASGSTTLTLRDNQTTTQGLNFPNIRETETLAIKPQILSALPANPTGTTSTTGVMAGIGGTCVITPQVTGRVFIIISGDASSTVVHDGAKADLRISAVAGQSAPANGAALSGTVIGNAVSMQMSGGGAQADIMTNMPFTVQGIATGLTTGSAYWIDLGEYAVTGGTGSLKSLTCTAHEL